MDHGQLNIPGRTNTINADLDRHKAVQKTTRNSESKAKARALKKLRAEAKVMVNALPAERLQSLASQMGVAVLQVKLALLKAAFWTPAALIKAEQKVVADAAPAVVVEAV